MKNIFLSLALLLCSVLGPAPNREYTISNVRVTDGDTVQCDADVGLKTSRHVIVRLQGIDAYELKDKPRGPAAKDFTTKWVTEAKGLKLRTHNDNDDKYGRTLGIITRDDGQVLNEELVKNGHAIEKDWK